MYVTESSVRHCFQIVEALRHAQAHYVPVTSPSAASRNGVPTRLSDWEIRPSEIVLGGVIYSCPDAILYEGKYRGAVVAVKQVPVARAEQALKREIEILTKLRHPRLCLFMGAHLPNPTEGTSLAIVYEFCSGGSLYSLLHRSNIALSRTQIKKVLMDVGSGLHYLHTFTPRILHRSVSTFNILLELPVTGASETVSVKLSNFGSIKALSKGIQAQTVLVNEDKFEYWLSPEVLRGEEYTEAADMYGFGLIGFELLTNSLPFGASHANPSSMQMLKAISTGGASVAWPDKGSESYSVPDSTVSILTACTQIDAANRPSALEVCTVLRSA